MKIAGHIVRPKVAGSTILQVGQYDSFFPCLLDSGGILRLKEDEDNRGLPWFKRYRSDIGSAPWEWEGDEQQVLKLRGRQLQNAYMNAVWKMLDSEKTELRLLQDSGAFGEVARALD